MGRKKLSIPERRKYGGQPKVVSGDGVALNEMERRRRYLAEIIANSKPVTEVKEDFDGQ